MSIELPQLPYAINALEPHISQKTLEFHHGKHHKAYVDNLNKLIAGTDLEKKSLEDIIKISAKDTTKAGIFNNSAQVWNHTFYWNCMAPKGGGIPTGKVAQILDASFGSFDKFKELFTQAAMTQFGSGWAWLVVDGNKLKISKTGNADTPMAHGEKPVLTIDVWEHAYYLDFQNRRPDYAKTFIESLINWNFVASQL